MKIRTIEMPGALLLLAVAFIALTSACANETDGDAKRGPAAYSGDATAGKGDGSTPDDHSGGNEVPGGDMTNGEQALLETLLQLAPLAPGHMMADVMNSSRAFRPETGLGLWTGMGFAWAKDAKLAKHTKEKTLSLAFTLPEDVTGECRLDNGAWKACADTFQASGLSEGFHEAHVRSTESHVIIGTARWHVDATAPKVFAVRAADKIMVKGNEALATLKCLAGQDEVNCQDGFAPADVTGSLSVTATDEAGNQASVTLTL
jgi:hypothetical protein